MPIFLMSPLFQMSPFFPSPTPPGNEQDSPRSPIQEKEQDLETSEKISKKNLNFLGMKYHPRRKFRTLPQIFKNPKFFCSQIQQIRIRRIKRRWRRGQNRSCQILRRRNINFSHSSQFTEKE